MEIFNESKEAGADIDTDKIWWVQAEAMVGFLNAYQLTGKAYFLETSYKTWKFRINISLMRKMVMVLRKHHAMENHF